MTPAARGFWLRIGAAALAALLLAPVFGLLVSEAPFHRVMTRTFLVSVIVVLVAGGGHPRGWPEKLRRMGLRGPGRLPRLLTGFGVAVVLLAGLVLLSWALGGRATRQAAYRLGFMEHFGRALLSGVIVAYLEELLCRGYLKDLLGGVMSAALYSAAHFFRPLVASAPFGPDYEPLAGFARLDEMVESWTDPRIAILGFLSLFVFGLALNRLRDRTHTLHLGIGIHAGLVFSVEIYRRVWVETATGDPWIFGGPRLHDGLLGSAVLGLLLLLALRAPLPRFLRRG